MLPKIKAQGVAEGLDGIVAFESIKFSNGVRIEAREDGLHVVAGEEDALLYDLQWGQIYANNADRARDATRAFSDSYGRELKGTSIQEYGDGDNFYVILEDGQIASVDTVSGTFNMEFPDEIYLGYTSKLYFTTSSDGYVFIDVSQPVYFRGDSTENGSIIIDQDTRYSITFEYDGYHLIGSVSAVPVDFNM